MLTTTNTGKSPYVACLISSFGNIIHLLKSVIDSHLLDAQILCIDIYTYLFKVAEADQATFTDLVMELTQHCLTDLQKARYGKFILATHHCAKDLSNFGYCARHIFIDWESLYLLFISFFYKWLWGKVVEQMVHVVFIIRYEWNDHKCFIRISICKTIRSKIESFYRYDTIGCTVLERLWKNIYQTLNSQKTPHRPPSRASYMSTVNMLVKTNRVITGSHWQQKITDFPSLPRFKILVSIRTHMKC